MSTQNRTKITKTVDFTGAAQTGVDNQLTHGFNVDQINAGDTDGVQVADTEANGLSSPSDFTNTTAWPLENTVLGNSDEIIGDIPLNVYRKIQTVTVPITERVFYTKVKAGAQPWVRVVMDDGSASSIYVNPTTGETGTISGVAEYSIQCMGDGYCLIKVYKVLSGSSLQHSVYAAPNGTSPSYSGDGATVDTFVEYSGSYEGTLADNIKFADGGASPVAPTTTVSKLIYKQAKWDARLVQKAGDPNDITNWIPVSSVDGYLMDESAGNVAVLRDADKWKKVSDDTWGDMVTNVELYSPKRYGYGTKTKRMFVDSTTPITPTMIVTNTIALHGGHIVVDTGVNQETSGPGVIVDASFRKHISRDATTGDIFQIVGFGGYTFANGYFDYSK